jgi:MSHA biogenesis protein MshL
MKAISTALTVLLTLGAGSLALCAEGESGTAAPGAPNAISTDEPRFNVDVSNASARTFFAGLVDGTAYNILVDPQVAGTVTLNLRQVTIEQVLDATRELYGYDYRRTSSGFLILPAAIQSRIYHLNYLDLQRYGISNTRISSGQVTQSDSNSQYGSGAGGGAPTLAQAPPAQAVGADGQPAGTLTGTAVVTRSDSDFWGGIEADLKAIIGKDPGRSLVINRQSGIILVRAMPKELRDVDDYLHQTANTVTRQVVIEAKIVEVELNSAYQAGINWAGILNQGNHTYFFGQSAPPNGFAGNPLTPTNSAVTVGPGNPINSLVTNALGGAFTISADVSNFNAFIELLASQGQTHVLSSPRVSTLNNQKAIIKAGTDEFFVTGVTSNTVASTATTTTNNVQLTPFFSGVALDVTPQIGDDNHVLLHIHPTVSEVTDQVKTLTISGSTNSMPLALSQIRESDDIVKAQSGQLIVIGGLMRETHQNTNYRTPILGDVPLLGKLFRSEQKQSTTVELVILLRPIIVGDNDWPTLANEQTSQLDELTRRSGLQ